MLEVPAKSLQPTAAGGDLPHLLIRLGESFFAIEVPAVLEVVQLPALQPVAESAGSVVGLVNMRGSILSVMDLDLRFGRPRARYQLDDRLVVLQHNDHRMALVVNEALGVVRWRPDQSMPLTDVMGEAEAESRYVDRAVMIDDKIVMLLDVQKLLAVADDVPAAAAADARAVGDTFWQELSAAEQQEFRDRASLLMQRIDSQQLSEQTLVAVFECDGEFFGLQLDFVREFFEAPQVTPVPCCPPHVIGNVNLRGDIVTVIDVRGALNLNVKPAGTAGKVVVVKCNGAEFGVLVDEWHDVVNLRSADVRAVPGGVQADGCCQGAAQFRDRMMSILDVPRLMQLERWVVDEEPGGMT
jgi:purine-binding chemotaxis protein CheW